MTLSIGDKVRVKQHGGGLGETLFQIEILGPGFRCMIREVSDTIKYAPQYFDTSLLEKVDK